MDELGLPPLPVMGNSSVPVAPQPSLGEQFSSLSSKPTATSDVKKTSLLGTTNVKKASTEEVALAKRIQHDPQTAMTYAAANQADNRLADGEVYRNLNEMSYATLLEKYGPEVAGGASSVLDANVALFNEQRVDRSAGQVAGDLALDAGAGLSSVLGSIGALALDKSSPLRVITNPIQEVQALITGERPMDPAIASATLGQEGASWLKSNQSEQIQRRAEVLAVFDSLDTTDNQAEFEEAIAGMDNATELRQLGASVARWGSDTKDTLGNLVSDPAMLGQVTANSMGSLIPSVKAAQLASKAAALSGSQLATKLAVPAAVGSVEASGAYGDSALKVMVMTEEELNTNSEAYRAMRSQGMTHQTAQENLASDTGRMAAAITLPLAMVGGKFAEKFELAPMTAGSLKGALSNVGKETLEEGFQSTVGALAGNAAIKENADSTQDMLEGVGQATAQGLAGGFGMAAALQGPGAAVKGTGDAIVAGATGVKAATGALLARANTKAEAGSTVSLDRTKEAAQGVTTSVDELAALAMPAPVEPPAETTGEQAPPVNTADIVSRVRSVAFVSAGELNKAPAIIKKLMNDGEDLPEGMDPADRSSLLVSTVEEIQNTKYTAAERQETMLWVANNMTELESLANEDLSIFGEQGTALQNSISNNIDVLRNNRLLAEARKTAESVEVTAVPELTVESLTSPEGQRAVTETVAAAQHNPIGTDPSVNRFILNQVDEGNLTLPVGVKRSIEVADALRVTADAAVAAKKQLASEAAAAGAVSANLRQIVDMVREDIQGGDGKDAANQYSLNRYVGDITRFMLTNDTSKAKQRLDNLKNFVIHFQNKVEAYGRSADLNRSKDNKITFRGYTGKGWREASKPDAYSVYTNPFSANSVFLAKAVAEDAKAIHAVYNTLVAAYGEQLGAEALPPLVLHPIMTGPAKKSQQGDVKDETVQATERSEASTGSNDTVSIEETGVAPKEEASESRPIEPTSEASPANSDGAPSIEAASVAGDGNADSVRDTAGERATGYDPVDAVSAVDAATPEASSYARPIPRITVSPVVDADQGLVVPATEIDPALAAAGDFSHLHKDSASGRNLFLEGVSVDPTKGRLLGEASPLGALMTALGHIREFAEQSGVGYYVDTTHGETLRQLLEAHGAFLVNGVNALLGQRTRKDGPTIGEEIDAGSPKLLQMNGRIFNLLDPRTGNFDARLVETAAVAAIHWAMTATGSVDIDREDVARSLGKSEAQVDEATVAFFSSGIQETRAAERLAQTILEFWGAETNGDAPMNEAQGIAQQLAAELLTLLDGRMVSTVTLSQVDAETGKPKKLNAIVPQTIVNAKEAAAVKKLGPAKQFLRDVSVKLAEPEFFFDAPPAKVKMTQKRNILGRISERVAKALRRHQEVKFMRNGPLVDMLKTFEYEELRAISGYQLVETGALNKAHAERVRGKNNSIDHALEGMLRHEGMLQHHAATVGKSPNEVATHFDWYQGRNGRIMAKGFTGQAIKWMRETFTPTVSVLDLSDPTSNNHQLFWSTVAQSLGVKTERKYRKDAVKEAQGKVDGPLRDAVDAIKAWVSDPTAGRIDKDILIQGLQEIGQAGSVKALHALLAVARYEHVMENGTDAEQAAFEHMLSLEADGVTDGPVNAMMHFITGAFTADQLENLGRGGVFIGSLGKTLNQFYEGGARKDDIYQTASNALRSGMHTVAEAVREGMSPRSKADTKTNAFASAQAMYRVLGHYGQLEYDGAGKLVFGRNVMKNPLTITVYGSSIKGVMGKVAAAISDDLSEKMTELLELRRETGQENAPLWSLAQLEGYEELYNDLTLLTNRRVFQTKAGEWMSSPTVQSDGKISWVDGEAKYSQMAGATQTALRDPLNFSFTPRNLEMLESNLLVLMGRPMEAAIDSIMGETRAPMKAIMEATQMQGEAFKQLFKAAVDKRLAEKRAAGELTDKQMLSMNDYNAVFEEMSKFAAIVESYDSMPGEESHINLSVAENVAGEEGSPSFFRTVAGRFRLGATLPQPGNVGVAAAPMLTISRGDAMMMTNYFADETSDLRVTQVYDGIEMPADGITAISQRINQASFQAWMENPTQSVADSFDNFLRQGMNQGLKDVEGFDAKRAQELAEELREMAMLSEARKRTLARVGLSVDHMASGEAPFIKEGELPENADELVDFLEQIREEELYTLQAESKVKVSAPVIQRASTRMRNLARMYGEGLRNGKVSLIKPADLITMMRDADMPAHVRELFFAVAPKLGDFSIFVGSRAELNAYHRELLPPSSSSRGIDVGKGMADVENKWLFISSPSPETILHESIHAAVAAMIYDHSADPSLVSEPTRLAIGNLTKLMDEFMGMDFLDGAETTDDLKATPNKERDALLLVQSVIQQALDRNQQGMGQAVALNEFIAWTLSNQHVGNVLGKTKTYVRLSKIVSQVVDFLRNLVGIKPTQRMMLDAIRFNAQVLFHAPENETRGAKMSRSSAMEAAQEGVTVKLEYIDLNQVSGLQSDATLREKAQNFHHKLNTALSLLGVSMVARTNLQNKVYAAAERAAQLFESNHFGMTPDGRQLFKEMQATFASTIALEPKALVRAQQIYNHVLAQLSYQSFLADPATTNPIEIERAERQYRALTGEYGYEQYGADKNNLLASFLALSQVSPEMRDALDKVNLPKNQEVDTSSTDAFLRSVGRSMIDSLSSISTRTGLVAKATVPSLDTLVESLGTLQKDAETQVEAYGNALVDAGNERLKSGLASLGNKAWDFADRGWKTTRPGLKDMSKRAIYGSASLLGLALSEQRGEVAAEKLLQSVAATPRMPKVISNLISEVIGVTDANWGVLRMVNEVRTKVQALRQDYREELPVLLASKFKRKLETHEWERLHLGLGKTDIGSLGKVYSIRSMARLLKDKSYLQAETTRLENAVHQLGGNRGNAYMAKIEDLAKFMVTGEVPRHMGFLRNAEAIARLLGARNQMPVNQTPSKDLVRDIDALTTLRAIGMLDTSTADTLASLAQTEEAGMFFTMLYLADTRMRESQKAVELQAILNGYKGHIPSERQNGANLIVADEADQVDLIQRGYRRVGTYAGIERDRKAYYYTNVSTKGTYQQGVLQTVHKTYFGVSAQSGFSANGATGGVISGAAFDDLQDDILKGKINRYNSETLLPVYDNDMNLVAYERSIDPSVLSHMNQNTHIGEMLGAWAGRQAEEELSSQYNKVLVNRLKDMWEAAKLSGDTAGFVNLTGRNKDPVLEDSRKLIPFEVWGMVGDAFGEDGFMVRRDVLDNVVGYRLPSVTDLWTGNSNLHPEVRETFRKTAIALFGLVDQGNNAFKYLATTEKFWQTLVSEAKSTIVVRSVVVPLSNLASNFVQLMVNGVRPRDIMNGMLSKLLEIEQYQRHQKMRVDLKGEMARYRTNPDMMLQLNARMKRLDDADARMTIWPLIAAGEFSTISEGMTQVDASLTSGRWAEWVRAQVDRLPGKLGTFGKYAVVARDTALYQGMARATQYGDFLAKAVLYDHMTQRKKQDHESTVRTLNEEFVNYNFLPGRTRSYTESMGITWFWAFKIRSMKIALRHIRNNPLRALMMSAVVPSGVGSPLTDNMAAIATTGGLGYSTGIGMLGNAPDLNPWYNLMK